MRIVYLLPSFFTLGNIFCGFYAIITAIHGSYTRSAYVVIIAGFFDVFDGKIARATNSTSRFGVEFDSLADLVSFGVAPGVLTYLWALHPLGRIGWLAAFLFVICGALRLARFNVQIDVVSSDRFVGLPIPCGAGMLVSTVIFYDYWFGSAQPDRSHSIPLVILIYLVAVLMVSNIKYRSFKKISMRGKNPFKIMVIASLALIIIAAKPQLTFFLIISAYIVFGLLEAIPGFNKILAFSRPKENKGQEVKGKGSLHV
jgi:CDP-diacylglycerol--serine O-phosphatidyltransferase